MFARFAAWCDLSGLVTEFVTGIGLSATGVAFVILLLFFIFGFVIDILALLLITVPILHPVAVAYGIDPIWFAVLVVIVTNLGTITPPVGITLFTFKGLAQDIPMSTVYRGAMPFVLGTMLAVIIFFAIPPLITWLPSILK